MKQIFRHRNRINVSNLLRTTKIMVNGTELGNL
jgi:hypothetical protein